MRMSPGATVTSAVRYFGRHQQRDDCTSMLHLRIVSLVPHIQDLVRRQITSDKRPQVTSAPLMSPLPLPAQATDRPSPASLFMNSTMRIQDTTGTTESLAAAQHDPQRHASILQTAIRTCVDQEVITEEDVERYYSSWAGL
jgi:hypothetical protein